MPRGGLSGAIGPAGELVVCRVVVRSEADGTGLAVSGPMVQGPSVVEQFTLDTDAAEPSVRVFPMAFPFQAFVAAGGDVTPLLDAGIHFLRGGDTTTENRGVRAFVSGNGNPRRPIWWPRLVIPWPRWYPGLVVTGIALFADTRYDLYVTARRWVSPMVGARRA